MPKKHGSHKVTHSRQQEEKERLARIKEWEQQLAARREREARDSEAENIRDSVDSRQDQEEYEEKSKHVIYQADSSTDPIEDKHHHDPRLHQRRPTPFYRETLNLAYDEQHELYVKNTQTIYVTKNNPQLNSDSNIYKFSRLLTHTTIDLVFNFWLLSMEEWANKSLAPKDNQGNTLNNILSLAFKIQFAVTTAFSIFNAYKNYFVKAANINEHIQPSIFRYFGIGAPNTEIELEGYVADKKNTRKVALIVADHEVESTIHKPLIGKLVETIHPRSKNYFKDLELHIEEGTNVRKLYERNRTPSTDSNITIS